MIIVTRLNGTEIVVNADLIETIEATPDTIVTLVDGTRYLVEEPPSTIIERVMGFRAAVLRLGDEPLPSPNAEPPPARSSADAEIVALRSRSED
jgi:flagellar protein FlbD